MSKISQKISAPGSAKMPTKGPHNPNVGTSGAGMAPKPSGGAPIPGNDRPSMPAQNGFARVANVGKKPSGSFMPLQNNAMANLVGPKVGQQNPNTSAAATKKPNRKGGAAFYGES